MLLDLDQQTITDLEDVCFQRSHEFRGNEFAVHTVCHAILFAGMHKIGADRKVCFVADPYLPDVLRNADIENLISCFNEDHRATA